MVVVVNWLLGGGTWLRVWSLHLFTDRCSVLRLRLRYLITICLWIRSSGDIILSATNYNVQLSYRLNWGRIGGGDRAWLEILSVHVLRVCTHWGGIELRHGKIMSSITLLVLPSFCFTLHRRYFILFISIIQIFIAMYTMSSRGGTEAFISLWSSIVLLLLCVGGTVIMRKFQSSVAVGFFMGSVVAASQMFMLVFLM